MTRMLLLHLTSNEVQKVQVSHLFAHKQNGAAGSVSAGSITYISNIFTVSDFLYSRAFGPCPVLEPFMGYSCPEVNLSRYLAILIRPKWPYHIGLNFLIPLRNLLRYSLKLSSIPFFRKSCVLFSLIFMSTS